MKAALSTIGVFVTFVVADAGWFYLEWTVRVMLAYAPVNRAVEPLIPVAWGFLAVRGITIWFLIVVAAAVIAALLCSVAFGGRSVWLLIVASIAFNLSYATVTHQFLLSILLPSPTYVAYLELIRHLHLIYRLYRRPWGFDTVLGVALAQGILTIALLSGISVACGRRFTWRPHARHDAEPN